MMTDGGTEMKVSKEQFEELVAFVREGHKKFESPAPSLAVGRTDGKEGIWDWHTGNRLVDENLCYDVIVVQDGNLTRKGFIAGKTPVGKAAVMEALRRRYVEKGVPEHVVQRGLRVRFGKELLECMRPDVWKAFDGCILRPRLNAWGNLSNAEFSKWADSVCKNMVPLMTGPRNEAFLEIVMGKDWRKAVPFSPDNYLWESSSLDY